MPPDVAEPGKPPEKPLSSSPVSQASPYIGNQVATRQWADLGLCALCIVVFMVLGLAKTVDSHAVVIGITFFGQRGVALFQIVRRNKDGGNGDG